MEDIFYRFALKDENEWNEFFFQNGFVVISNILSKENCDNLYSACAKHANEDFAAIHSIERDPPEGYGVKEVWDVMCNRAIINILDTLKTSQVGVVGSQILFKKAGTRYADQAWNPHQDNSYPQTCRGAYTTTNIFLEDADPENGGLYIYPGSHREPLLPFVPTESFREKKGANPGNTVEVPSKYKKVDLYVKKGDMLVLHGHCIHGSYLNKSNRSRPLFSANYVPRGELFISGRNSKRKFREVRPPEEIE